MKVIEAKRQVLSEIETDLEHYLVGADIDRSPGLKDSGKFLLEGKRARVIHPYNGFHANINLDWFDGSTAPPKINYESFFWYVFALRGERDTIVTYHICDYHQVRDWVLEFDAPMGNNHQDHHDWRGEIQILEDQTGYFRWGDEPNGEERPSRYIKLRNIVDVVSESSDAGAAHDAGEISSPDRRDFTVSRIVRDTALSREIKRLHNYRCQVCGKQVDLGNRLYAEAHHIKPLGSPHDGPDVRENIVCVCPTCHVRLDYGAVRIDYDDLRKITTHSLSRDYIRYHNEHLFKVNHKDSTPDLT